LQNTFYNIASLLRTNIFPLTISNHVKILFCPYLVVQVSLEATSGAFKNLPLAFNILGHFPFS